jgi:ribosomal protein S18 acetylase RimI-like enzyme
MEIAMENIQPRPCVYSLDRDSLLDLVRACRRSTGVDIYPTPWRVRLLLTSRVWDPAQDACIWECASEQAASEQAASQQAAPEQAAPEQAAALAFLWRRRMTDPYLVVERFVHPSFANRELAADLLAWASRRAERMASAQDGPLKLYTSRLAASLCPDDPLDAHGFIPLKPHPDVYNVYYERPLHAALPIPALPLGYSLRPVNSLPELNALHDAATFAAVNPAHQQECFESGEYSHLVVITLDGSLAAYCECSVDWAEWQAGGEKIGWIDYVETLATYRGKGLGQAVLWAGLRRLQEWGAETARLVTISSNVSANRLYEKTGFSHAAVREPVSYEKIIRA